MPGKNGLQEIYGLRAFDDGSWYMGSCTYFKLRGDGGS